MRGSDCVRIFSQVRPRNSTSAADLLFRSAVRRGAHDESAGEGAFGFGDHMAQARTFLGRVDAPRDADVIDRGHVDQKTARQGHVAGDARALFAQRLLGDLHDDFLAGLQHFGDELRPARFVPMVGPPRVALLAAIAAAPAHGPLEARALRFGDARGHGVLRRSLRFAASPLRRVRRRLRAAMSAASFMLLVFVMVLVMLSLFLMLVRFGLGDELLGFRGAFGRMGKFFLEHAQFRVSLGFGAHFFVARLGELLRQGTDLFIGEFVWSGGMGGGVRQSGAFVNGARRLLGKRLIFGEGLGIGQGDRAGIAAAAGGPGFRSSMLLRRASFGCLFGFAFRGCPWRLGLALHVRLLQLTARHSPDVRFAEASPPTEPGKPQRAGGARSLEARGPCTWRGFARQNDGFVVGRQFLARLCWWPGREGTGRSVFRRRQIAPLIALTSSAAAALTPASAAAAASPPVILALAWRPWPCPNPPGRRSCRANGDGWTRLPHVRLRGGDVTRGLVLLLVRHLRRRVGELRRSLSRFGRRRLVARRARCALVLRLRGRREHLAALLLHLFDFAFDGCDDVVVVFEIFEEVADVKEGVAIEADVHEGRLHAGKHARDAAFVDASD